MCRFLAILIKFLFEHLFTVSDYLCYLPLHSDWVFTIAYLNAVTVATHYGKSSKVTANLSLVPSAGAVLRAVPHARALRRIAQWASLGAAPLEDHSPVRTGRVAAPAPAQTAIRALLHTRLCGFVRERRICLLALGDAGRLVEVSIARTRGLTSAKDRIWRIVCGRLRHRAAVHTDLLGTVQNVEAGVAALHAEISLSELERRTVSRSKLIRRPTTVHARVHARKDLLPQRTASLSCTRPRPRASQFPVRTRGTAT